MFANKTQMTTAVGRAKIKNTIATMAICTIWLELIVCTQFVLRQPATISVAS
jgi:hypothetical protein